MNTEREQPEGEEDNLHDMDTEHPEGEEDNLHDIDTERDSRKAKRTTYITWKLKGNSPKAKRTTYMT
jgi:hypothetical protein